MAYKVFLGGAVGTAGNYDPSGVPADGDHIVLNGRTVTTVVGADQSSIEPASLRIYKSCSVDVASITVPWQIGPVLCEIGLPSENGGNESGPSTIALDFTADPVNLTVFDTADGVDGAPCVNIRGTDSGNVVTVKGGSVGIGTLFPGEAATVATLNVAGDNASVVVGFGVTLTTYNHRQGHGLLQCAATTLNIDSGTVETRGSGAITTVQCRGTLISNSTGTITNLNTASTGVADFSQSPAVRTVTNTFMYGDACSLNVDNNALSSGIPVVVFTNGIDTLKGAQSNQIIVPTDLTVSFSTLQMPTITVNPLRNARRSVKASDYTLRSFDSGERHWYAPTVVRDTRVDWETPRYIQVRWDQVVSLIGAIDGMAERAKEGVARGTNLAAQRVRRHMIDSVTDEITLDRSHIEDAIEVTADATEDSPAAQVSVRYVQESMLNFELVEGEHGVEAYIRRDEGRRFIPASFLGAVRGREGVFQRENINGHRAGRLPIQEKMGPSVYDTVKETPGFLKRETAYAREALVGSIMRVRDQIVLDFTTEGTVDDPNGKFTSLIFPVLRQVIEMPAELTPIIERIAQDVEDWLKQVNPVNGYVNSFTVERRKRQGNFPKSGQVLAVINQGQPIKLENSSQDKTGWDVPFYIDIFVDPDESRATPLDCDINTARSDAEKALAFEDSSRNRGGLAHDTMIRSPIPFVENKCHGIQVRATVRFFTQFNNPYRSAYSNIP